MNADELRALQAPLKDRYRDDPQAALITLERRGRARRRAYRLQGRNRPRAGAWPGCIPRPAAAGWSCARATCCWRRWSPAPASRCKAVATALGIALRSGEVSAEGDLDFRGTLGVDKEAPVGFTDIRLTFELDADASPEQLETLLKLTERYCVVLQTLKRSPALSAELRAECCGFWFARSGLSPWRGPSPPR